MLAILPIKLMGETGFRSITEKCLLAVVPPPDSLMSSCRDTGTANLKEKLGPLDNPNPTFTQDADSEQKGTEKTESLLLMLFERILAKYT